MKISLEDERQALLERIEASRSLYRQILIGEVASGRLPTTPAAAARRSLSSYGRHVRDWVADHPLSTAAGVALLVWLAPSMMRRLRGRQAARVRITEPDPRAGTIKALATVLILLLRHPRSLTLTDTALASVWRWLRYKRGDGSAAK